MRAIQIEQTGGPQSMADELFAVVASGQVKIEVGRRYALAEAAQAHKDL